MPEPPDLLCLWHNGCVAGQYISAMKISVGVNLLVGVWIWLHNQSGSVESRITSEVGGIVGVVEEASDRVDEVENDGTNIRLEIDKIIAQAQDSIKSVAMNGFFVAALITVVILLVAFLLNNDYPVYGFWWWCAAMFLATCGPIVMVGTYVWIIVLSRKAVKKATEQANSKAKQLQTQKPPTRPRLV